MHSETTDPEASRGRAVFAAIQGSYFVVTGLWPIVHLRSFELVTGPKREGWLVKTVGALITVVGAVVLDAARRRRVDRSVAMLAMGSAAALGAVDVVYVAKRRIAPIYLADAVLELGLLAGWTVLLSRRL